MAGVARHFNSRVLDCLRSLPMDGITLVDVGAAGDIEPRWKPLEPILNYVGFEPDERSRMELERRGNACASYRVLPFAVWDTPGRLDINLCRKPQVSSHYVPNRTFLNRFSASERFDIVERKNLEAKTLDSLNLQPDFLKVDIQGGELNALKGAPQILSKILGLEIEVEFLPLYDRQPLFGNVCSYLSPFGLEFVDFVSLCRWERSRDSGYGQCVFGDGLFLRCPEDIVEMNQENASILSKYLGICLIYNRFDLIDRSMELVSPATREKVEPFLCRIKSLRRVDSLVRRMTRVLSYLFFAMGLQYRPHNMC